VDGTETGWGRPAEPAPRWRALLDRARHGRQDSPDDEETQRQSQTGGNGQQPGRPGDPRGRQGFGGDSFGGDSFGNTEPPQAFERRSPSRIPSLGERLSQSERRPSPLGRAPLDQQRPPAEHQQRPPAEQRPLDQRPLDQRPLDRGPGPLDQRPLDRGPGALERGPGPFERPVNPLDPRRRPQPPVQPPAPQPPVVPEHGGGYASDQQNFFNPSTRSVPPRGAASVGSASVAPVQPPQAFAPSPLPARPASAPPTVPQMPQMPVRPASAAPAPVSAGPAPTSPAPARIEWRQTRSEPSEIDRALAVLRRKMTKPRVMAFANPKGGVHKTTATVLAAATVGSVRGRGVLAWDDNELRGTLGLRAGSARHARTIRHLVGDLLTIENMHADELMQTFDGYLRHASDGSYDVLAGEENPRFAQRLDQSTVQRVLDLLRRTHDVICVDTGNNVESVNWQTVMRSADQLVVTTVPREDAAFTADWMLDVLNESGQEELVANAVTLISCPSSGKMPLLDDLTKHFATRTRAVAVVPYDPALEVGSSIEYGVLQPETKAAWQRAASVMIEPYVE
jgi:MinD-like ATPase involved in chromosome partitioning or flagellar assembly